MQQEMQPMSLGSSITHIKDSVVCMILRLISA